MIFVVGNSRSGTTMMGRILGAHESVFTFDELHFFGELVDVAHRSRRLTPTEASRLMARLVSIQREGYLVRGGPEAHLEEAERILGPDETELRTPLAVFERFLRDEAWRGGASIPCDQTPRNVFYIPEILDAYPDARIVHMIRDPRDVLLSQKNRYLRRRRGAVHMPRSATMRSWTNYHSIATSRMWNAAVRSGLRHVGSGRVVTVRFEELLSDPERIVRGICAALAMEYDPAMLNVPQVGSSNRTDQAERSGIDNTRTGRWRDGNLRDSEVFLCQQITSRLMADLGFEAEPIRMNPLGVALEWLTLPVKMGLALGLNRGRMRNLKDTIRRRLG